jgi:hypothetical protein
MDDAGHRLPVLDGNTEPDVRRRRVRVVALVEKFHQQGAALREHLVDVPVCSLHGVKYLGDMVSRHLFVKELAHGIDKGEPRLRPCKRLNEPLGAQGEIEAAFERMAGHAAEAFRKPLDISVISTRANLRAAGDRVPCGIGPLDGALLGHADSKKSVGCPLVPCLFYRNIAHADCHVKSGAQRIGIKTPSSPAPGETRHGP